MNSKNFVKTSIKRDHEYDSEYSDPCDKKAKRNRKIQRDKKRNSWLDEE